MSLYTATEFGTDLQTLAFLGNHQVDHARLRAFRRHLGLELPRAGRWLLRVATQHGIGRAELPGWILAGDQKPEPAGLTTVISPRRPDRQDGPDGLPSARYGGLLRMGQTPDGAYWGADLHRKAMPVYALDPTPDGIRGGWRRKFDRLDDFVFFGAKAALCQRDRITGDEFIDLARERGVRPEELVPDSLEDEREILGRMGLRRAKRVPPIANRFVWLDVVLTRAYLSSATSNDIAKLWVDIHKLHHLREESDKLSDPCVAAFWLFRHTLFNDAAGYKRVLAKAGKRPSPLVAAADADCQRLSEKKKGAFDRVALVRSIENRISTRGR